MRFIREIGTYLKEHFISTIKNNRGTMGGVIAGVTWGQAALAAASAGAGIAGAAMSGGDGGDVEFNYQQLPDYPESEDARKEWWSTLQKWGADKNYGAISPDWEDIWDRAKRKISQYYWGSPTSPGLAGKIKSTIARNNMGDSPALGVQLSRLGVEEANQLGDMSSEQATQAAQLSETARNNWLSSIMGLSSLKPQYMTSVGVSEPSSSLGGNIMSTIGQLGTTFAQNQSQNTWWDYILSKYRNNSLPATTPASIIQEGYTDPIGVAKSPYTFKF